MSNITYRILRGRVSARIPTRVPLITALLISTMIVVLSLSVTLGSFVLELHAIVDVLRTPNIQDSAHTVVWQLRLPRFITACFVGIMLAISGALLQGTTRNPLADPSLVGVSQGASFAVVFLIVIWPETPIYLRPIAAFGGGMLAAMLVQWIALGKQSAASLRFILVGIGVAALISAGTTAMLTYGQVNRAMSALGWLAGSVHTATWEICLISSMCCLACVPVLIWSARPISALKYGPEIATGLGLKLRRDRFILISLAVALAGFATAAAGPIGFVGLIAPQIALRLVRCGSGAHIILSGFVGAILVSSADLLGRYIAAPIQLPAGLVSAVIGVPVFILIILKRAKYRSL